MKFSEWLMTEEDEKLSSDEKEYLEGVFAMHKSKGKYKDVTPEAGFAMLVKAYQENKGDFDFAGWKKKNK